MPINRDVPIGELDRNIRDFLLTGAWMSTEPEPTPERLADLWVDHGDSLTAEWAAAHPLLRPWYWWIAGDRWRRQVRRVADHPHGRNWFGLPEEATPDEPDYESQGACLERSGLLTDSEQALLPLTEWQKLGVTNVADLKYLSDHRELLRGRELRALKAHLRKFSVEPKAIGSIQ